ncbi:Uncharacterised protein [Shigella sonnei]|nr:Uncharacterised protein [Shigella sonnei]
MQRLLDLSVHQGMQLTQSIFYLWPVYLACTMLYLRYLNQCRQCRYQLLRYHF